MRTPAFVLILFLTALITGGVVADTIQMGSYMDVTYVNVVTDLSIRNIQAIDDYPAEASYSISAKGIVIDTPAGPYLQPATGLISAFMDVQTVDLSYAEITTASGYIDSFVKDMYYQGGEFLI